MSELPAFAPSELVLFHGDRFAGKSLLGSSVPLLHTDAKVGAADLGRAVLEAAIAANVRAGEVRLERRDGKALFGLMTTQDLVAVPGAATARWPEGSLEASAARLVAAAGEKGVPVVDLVTALLKVDTGDAWVQAVDLVKEGLVARRLLDVQEKKRLGVFRTKVVVAPEATVARARSEPDAPVRDLVEGAALDAETRDLLRAKIKAAIERRTDDRDDMDWD